MKLVPVALAVALAGVAACGDPAPEAPRPGAGAQSPEAQPPEHDMFPGFTYGCGQGSFTADDVEAATAPSDEILAALEELRQTPDGAFLPEDGWVVVSETEDRTMVLAPLGDQFASAAFDRKGGGWDPAGWGDCTPSLYVDGRSVMSWAFAEDAYPPDPDATTLSIRASEQACSSGRNVEGQVDAEVVYGEDRIGIVVTAPGLVPGRGYDCPGNPIVDYVVDLREPVGDREVVDPSVYPPAAPGTKLR